MMARGGSQRIPRKNLQPFCGLPLIEWTFLQARQAKMIDSIYLVSDDEEIHALGERYGVRHVWQSHEECEHGVHGGLIASVRFLQRLKDEDRLDSVYVTAMPTSPLRPPGMLDDMLTFFFDKCVPEGQYGLGCQAEIRHPGISYEIEPGRSYLIENSSAPGYLTYSMLAGVGFVNEWVNTYHGEVPTIERALELAEHPEQRMPAWRKPQRYYRVQPWACHDVDIMYELLICETAMERMILCGHGKEIYERHA